MEVGEILQMVYLETGRQCLLNQYNPVKKNCNPKC